MTENTQPEAENTQDLDPESRRNIRKSVFAMLIAVVFLAVFNSEGFTVYARDFSGSGFSDHLVSVADWWNELMTEAGATRLYEVTRETFLDLKETQW